jgi:uncharacterized membrane protein YjgN (DUF898 family)
MPFCSNCGTQYIELPPRCACGFLLGSSTPEIARTAPAEAGSPAETVGRFEFRGMGGELLLLYVKTFFLSIITLGIYSFWGRTEIRRFLWRNTSFAGQKFEYHGTGKELFWGGVKFLALIAAWFAVVFIVVFMTGEKQNSLLIPLLVYIPLLGILPWALHGAFRYRASRTSWQGRRFFYKGDVLELAKIFWLGAILSLLTLTIYTPFFLMSMRKYFFENLTYGGQGFQFTGEGRDLLWPYLKFLLLAIPTLTLYRFWFQAEQNNYAWGKTSFAGAPFRSTISGSNLLLYALLEVVGGIFTLGIAVPWIRCAQMQYVFSNLVMPQLPSVNLSSLAAGGEEFGDATGEVLSADADLGDSFGL